MKHLLFILGLGLLLQLGIVSVNLEKGKELVEKHQDRVERAFKELAKR